MLACEHAVTVQQQHRDADELLDFDQGLLIVFIPVVLGRRRRQPGKVGQGFRAFFRQRGCVPRCEPEPTQESAAPVEQGAAAVGQRGIGVRQQQFEAKPPILELRTARAGQRIQRAATGHGWCRVIRKHAGQPAGRFRAAASKPPAQTAMQFRRWHGHAELSDFGIHLGHVGQGFGHGFEPER